MALYTITLCDLLRNYEIFGFPYPIYDEKERVKFETAFKQHFYFREICCPEPERFIWYLRDKMTTVFPYYNELMRTATIEYDVENPYNLTETYTRKTDSKGKAAGFMSSVGTTEGVQDSEGSETREGATTGNVKVSGMNSETENVKTETSGNETGRDSRTRKETVTGETDETSKIIKKHLDTPQGKLNLDNTDYLSDLTQEEGSRNAEETKTANVTENGSNERETEGTSETVRTVKGSNGSETVSSGSDNSEVKTAGKVTQEEKTKADSNTRTESTGETVEEYTMTRKGNIGVNPASYEIDSHIKTQKTLKRIYEMFFDECEDLFMLVY